MQSHLDEFGRDGESATAYHELRNDITEFARISRPRVGGEPTQDWLGKIGAGEVILLGREIGEVVDEL